MNVLQNVPIGVRHGAGRRKAAAAVDVLVDDLERMVLEFTYSDTMMEFKMSCSCTGYDNTGFRIHGVMEEWRIYQ